MTNSLKRVRVSIVNLSIFQYDSNGIELIRISCNKNVGYILYGKENASNPIRSIKKISNYIF